MDSFRPMRASLSPDDAVISRYPHSVMRSHQDVADEPRVALDRCTIPTSEATGLSASPLLQQEHLSRGILSISVRYLQDLRLLHTQVLQPYHPSTPPVKHLPPSSMAPPSIHHTQLSKGSVPQHHRLLSSSDCRLRYMIAFWCI